MKLAPPKNPPGILLKTFPVGPLGCNCAILVDAVSKEALLIDPGADFERIRSEAEKLGAKIKAILHTHAHFDHMGASEEAHLWSQAPLLLHPGDQFLWENVPMQGRLFQMNLKPVPKWTGELSDDQELTFGEMKLKTLFTPGHTPGSCCFVVDDLLFAGDTLFQGSIGRTDLWGGDYNQISKSIKDRLYVLDDDTRVICGHGPATQIGVEKRTNPFVRI